MADLLLELLSEEIPAGLQKDAAQYLKKAVTQALVEEGLHYEAAVAYWTPRRLTLDLRGLSECTALKEKEYKGPMVGAPQAAVAGFLRKVGLKDIDEAQIIPHPKKGAYYYAKIIEEPRKAAEILALILPKIIENFSWPKSMHWEGKDGSLQPLHWIRPLRNILCLLAYKEGGSEVVDFSINHLTANAFTYGHRFMGAVGALNVSNFDDYAAQLAKNFVVLDAQKRKEIILNEARQLAFAKGLCLVEDDALAEEIAGLVEWPVVFLGEFSPSFLQLPAAIIRLTIRKNQKNFVLKYNEESEELAPFFICVANLIAQDGGKLIKQGNEKVIAARLADALYFWQQDQSPKDKFAALAKKSATAPIVFHAKLGSLGKRLERLQIVAALLRVRLVCVTREEERAPIEEVEEAIRFAKADLLSKMVGEFPELQGFMGGVYATHYGLSAKICEAIATQYKPQGLTDSVPKAPLAALIALTEKLEYLTSFWLVGEQPTSSRDPYALRRAALGFIRLLLVGQWRLPLAESLQAVASKLGAGLKLAKDFNQQECVAGLQEFILQRLKIYLREEQGLRPDVIEACFYAHRDDILAIEKSATILQNAVEKEQFSALFSGIKRVDNILASMPPPKALKEALPQKQLMQTPQEHKLFSQLQEINKELKSALPALDYFSALNAANKIVEPIEDFFAHVLVNDADRARKDNLLLLLYSVQHCLQQIADFSQLKLNDSKSK